MGRWGHCDLSAEIAGTSEGPECDVLSSFGEAKIYTDDGQVVDGTATVAVLREKLDAGLGDKLMKKYRDLVTSPPEPWMGHYNKYQVIILGALIMTTGARLNDEDIQYLRQLASEVGCNEHQVFLEMGGFRGPGKRQFLVALDHYKPGTPRNFRTLSCHACGRTKAETGKTPLKCGRCGNAWFCNKECLKGFWRVHKPNCGPPGFLMNV